MVVELSLIEAGCGIMISRRHDAGILVAREVGVDEISRFFHEEPAEPVLRMQVGTEREAQCSQRLYSSLSAGPPGSPRFKIVRVAHDLEASSHLAPYGPAESHPIHVHASAYDDSERVIIVCLTAGV